MKMITMTMTTSMRPNRTEAVQDINCSNLQANAAPVAVDAMGQMKAVVS